MITILFGGIFFILWQGALLVQHGEMTIGDLFSFIIYTGIIGGAIASLGTFYTQLAGALGATDRILEIMESTPEIVVPDVLQGDPVSLSGDIVFRDVTFRYPSRPDTNVLKGIDMEIGKGQKVALVGASGAGKSTIVSLLMRFHEVDTGAILINGQDVRGFDLFQYRKNFATVPQDVILLEEAFGKTSHTAALKRVMRPLRKLQERPMRWSLSPG